MQKMIVRQTMACLLGAALVLSQPGIASVTEASGKAFSVRKEGETILVNGGFENGTEGWKADPKPETFEVKSEAGSAIEGSSALNFWNTADISFKCVQTIDSLPAGTYKVTAQSQGADGEKVSVYLNGEKGDVSQENSGWGNWTESSGIFTITSDMANVEAGVFVECKGGAWGWIDDISIKAVSGDSVETPAPSGPSVPVPVSLDSLKELVATLPSDYGSMGFVPETADALKEALAAADSLIKENSSDASKIAAAYNALSAAVDGLVISSDLFIKKISNYNKDSIRGMDVSSYLSIMKAFGKVKENMKASGASEAGINKTGFKDWTGKVLDEQGFFDLLAASGVNYIRIRVWNNPYDANGKGYGGGNNDIDAAVEMGKYITKAGMKVLVDFHLSDFWADPAKQKAPKAWSGYTVDQKAEAVSVYIKDCLTKLKDNGVNTAMVQVGNETNNGVCGESKWNDMNKIFDAGCDAVHNFDKNILTAVHFTDAQKDGELMGCAASLADYDGDGDGTKEGVSYDVFAASYYPNYHGTMDNITSLLSDIAKKYDKYVVVAETSWPNTYKIGHSTGEDDFSIGDYVNYNVSLQGQANEVRDVINAVNNIDIVLSNGDKAALGFFYWEPAWISAMTVYDENGNLKADAEQIAAENKTLDVECGSGWASSYAAEYDPDDAGVWWGGSAMTNKGVFDFNGKPLSVFHVFDPDYLIYGAKAPEVKADRIISPDEISITVGQTVDPLLPKVTVIYNDSSELTKEVNWKKEDIEKVNAAAATIEGIGNYTINGTLADDASCAVTVPVKVEGVNLLTDPGFENQETAWSLTGDGVGIKTEDPHSGKLGAHFWSDSSFKFTVSTTATVSKAGYYSAYIWMQGSGTKEGDSLKLVAVTGDGKQYQSESAELAGWQKWKQAVVNDIYVSEDMLKDGKNTVTLSVEAALSAGAWGTLDDASLYLGRESGSPVAPVLSSQTVSGKTSYTKTYGDKAFLLDAEAEGALTYQTSNKAVATVSSSGKVTINGAGVAVITVKAAATEKYAAASKKITVTVKPGKVSGVKAKAAKKKITVSWKKSAKAEGYQIQYSTSKNFKNAKKVTVKGASKVIKGVKGKKTYYVRVRAYAANGKAKITGAYSSTVKVKVK